MYKCKKWKVCFVKIRQMFSVKSMCCKKENLTKISSKKIREKPMVQKSAKLFHPTSKVRGLQCCIYLITQVKGQVHESILIVSVKINYILGYSVFQISKSEVKNRRFSAICSSACGDYMTPSPWSSLVQPETVPFIIIYLGIVYRTLIHCCTPRPLKVIHFYVLLRPLTVSLFLLGRHKEMSSILADQQRPRVLYKPNEYSCAHGAQINFGDLIQYLTYGSYSIFIVL